MRAINIFGLTRVSSVDALKRYEKQMSDRPYFLTIKKWEIEGLKKFIDRLCNVLAGAEELEFFYSFQIPKLGKEFDLLRISEDMVVNVELKSSNVTDEAIQKQLKQNRYYLSTLGKNIRSYTYISSSNRLVRLTGSGRLIEADFNGLASDLEKQKLLYSGNIEELFREEKYLLSPLTDPDRFLEGEYFLTFQQRDIKRNIVNNVKSQNILFQGFTGLPGTGKTLLLYDIAMELSQKKKVCVLHFGSYPKELEKLSLRLKRIDFYKCRELRDLPDLSDYSAVLVDEGHWISIDELNKLEAIAIGLNIPVIFSYDREDIIAYDEAGQMISENIEKLPSFVGYKMTNRIRTNNELSAFIRGLMHRDGRIQRRKYPSITVVYAGDYKEAAIFIRQFKNKGYIYIRDNDMDIDGDSDSEVMTTEATCQEFDRVVCVINDKFYYDENDYLRYKDVDMELSPVRSLFHSLSRARLQLGLVVIGDEVIFENIMRLINP